ncbi:P-loop NTPase family protein [Sporosarcina aquimarina]|uniref:Topology modulation protein n=1 Tax=Sporosarcina aquimarina TaxID=114975 RepID=A0ABU4FXL6_9BACL|nr:topology modulation protein [Sporosarcina aquimarina]MDW0109443.1 topology modulation protein [Sporosarcina aquimarina]
MQRIVVLGVSAGVGKSTFARQLGAKLTLPVTYLDRLYFEPGWKEVSEEVFQQRQAEVCVQRAWIIEGNYSKTLSLREAHADTIIYLELPLLVCLGRVVKRRINFHQQTRPELGVGCPEKMDWEFLKYIVTTYNRRKFNMRNRMNRYEREGKEVIRLFSRRQIQEYLQKEFP